MKKTRKSILLFLLALLGFVVSCEDNDDNPGGVQPEYGVPRANFVEKTKVNETAYLSEQLINKELQKVDE
jgi:hypothetical protein